MQCGFRDVEDLFKNQMYSCIQRLTHSHESKLRQMHETIRIREMLVFPLETRKIFSSGYG